MTKKIDHMIKNAIENGNIIEINVPNPNLGSYRFAKAKIIGKYGSNGEIIFVTESPTR